MKQLFTLLILSCLLSCSAHPRVGGEVTAWLTTADRTHELERTTFKTVPAEGTTSAVKVNPNAQLNEVDGFGFAISTATAWNLLQMTPEKRSSFLKGVFSRESGIGSSLIRVAIGASDFCIRDEYTWCDKAGLENFAIHPEDKNYLFPILHEIYRINPEVKIIASPWSCPKWMKGCHSKTDDPAVMEETFDSWRSGRLKPSCYSIYAEYLVRWIETMEKEGFDIYAMTMQNEPLNHGNSISMYMPWKDQTAFIKVLGPALRDAGLDTKILLYDHNYNYDRKEDQIGYVNHVYEDLEARKWAAGSAWHNYGGKVEELDNVIGRFPDKEIYFTESSIGKWNYDDGSVVGGKFGKCLLNDFNGIFFGTLRRGGRGVTYWNLMLDENNMPHNRHEGACDKCYGGVTISSKDYSTITGNSQWFDAAHASLVIQPGACRIDTSSTRQNGVDFLLFRNPDDTIGAILLNKTDKAGEVAFSYNGAEIRYTVPAASIASLSWSLEQDRR